MSENLKPCPFCGGEAEFERVGNRRQSTIVICQECGALHESNDEGEFAGRSWNRRASKPVEKINTDDGSVVVPVTPTSAMLARMVEVYEDISENGKISDAEVMGCVWEAALATAREEASA